MMGKLKEKVLSPEIESAANPSLETTEPVGLDERILQTLYAASEKKAVDLTVLDLRSIASFTDFFVLATGGNKRQVQAIADEVVEQLKRSGTRAARVEGYQNAEWVLVDYGDFIVHVFDEKARRFYDLERLWREARRVDVSPEKFGSEISSPKSEISDLK